MMRGVSTEDGLTWCFQARIRVCLGQPRGTTHCSFEDTEQFHQTQAVRLTLPTPRFEPRHVVTALDLRAIKQAGVEVCLQSGKSLLSHPFIFRAVTKCPHKEVFMCHKVRRAYNHHSRHRYATCHRFHSWLERQERANDEPANAQ